MKLVSIGKKGKERAGLVWEDKIIDINKVNPGIPETIIEILQGQYLDEIRNCFSEENKPLPGSCYADPSVRLGAPISSPSQIICIGLNYYSHAKEAKAEIPATPLLFSKAVSSINGPYDDIIHPGFDTVAKMDYEVELAIIMGKTAKHVKADNVFSYIAGYTLFNDVSARDMQFSDGQWFRGKSVDTFGPIGPYLITTDEIKSPHALQLNIKVNGEVRQNDNTGKMIFLIPQLIEFITATITLKPGDIIATGTPAGVGVFMNPPRFLQPGDVVELEGEGLGSQKNKVVLRG